MHTPYAEYNNKKQSAICTDDDDCGEMQGQKSNPPSAI